MPEGHTVHRLANTFAELFGSKRLEVSSPQGRFVEGAQIINEMYMISAQAYGKHMYLGFGPEMQVPDQDQLWLRVHLGLYGSWTFASDGSSQVAHAIGATARCWTPPSRTTIGALLMNQQVLAGVGNIYRAEVLFRAGIDPLAPGNTLTSSQLQDIWDDLVVLMRDGVRVGAIITTQPKDRLKGLSAIDFENGRPVTRQNTDDDTDAVPRNQSF